MSGPIRKRGSERSAGPTVAGRSTRLGNTCNHVFYANIRQSSWKEEHGWLTKPVGQEPRDLTGIRLSSLKAALHVGQSKQAGLIMPRRAHKKSRNGCAECKRRHMKVSWLGCYIGVRLLNFLGSSVTSDVRYARTAGLRSGNAAILGYPHLIQFSLVTLPAILPHQNPYQLWKPRPELTRLNRLGRSTWRMRHYSTILPLISRACLK